MRAAWYERTGPAEAVIEVGDMPAPKPGAGEVLVQIVASGINPADVKRRAGWGGMAMDHPRIIPHCDGSGVIAAVGNGVPTSRLGSRVWLWNAQGGYGQAGRAFGTAAEAIALPADQAVPLPDCLSFEQGACLGVPAMTAHRCVFADGPVDGMTVLVQGGAGAVGHLAIQMARLGGARVLTTVSSAEGAAHASSAGAETIDRHNENVVERVDALTDGRAIDRIIEVDFAANLEADIAMLAPNAILASYSSSSDPNPVLPYYRLATKGLNVRFVQGFALPAEARRDAQAFVADHAGALQVKIGSIFPLETIVAAHKLVGTGSIGNTVVRISDND